MPFLSLQRRILYCLISACLVCLSFPNFLQKTLSPPFAFLGWVALIPFFIALRGTRPGQAALLGWLFGFVQFGLILYWIAFLEAAGPLSGLAWAALTLYLGFFFLVFGWSFVFLLEEFPRAYWVAPFLWTGLETIRGSFPWGGFPWAELGYSQAPYPLVLVFTSLLGVHGLTFLMVWFNLKLSEAWAVRDSEGRGFIRGLVLFFKKIGIVPWTVLAVVLVVGALEMKTASMVKIGKVALLQPGIDEIEKWSKANEQNTYDRLSNLAGQAEVHRPDLILWPEAAAPAYLLSTPEALRRVVAIVRSTKTYHLVGCLDETRDPRGLESDYNAAVAFDPKGKVLGVYHKRHLVPFGEFVPFQKYLSFLGPVVGDLGTFEAGNHYEKFQAGSFTYSPMICYEVIFPEDARKALATGADALVNISNDAWYGRTASAYQHALMAVVRSAEEQRPLLRAANTGISLATDPFGRVLESTGLFEDRYLMADVFGLKDKGPTPYARWGDWFSKFCGGLAGLLWAWAFFRKRNRKKGTWDDP